MRARPPIVIQKEDVQSSNVFCKKSRVSGKVTPRVHIFDIREHMTGTAATSERIGEAARAQAGTWGGSFRLINRTTPPSKSMSTTERTWFDRSEAMFSSDCFGALPSFGEFDVFAEGVALYKRRGPDGDFGEDAFDDVRRTMESCDVTQGFVVSVDLDSAFGGFASELMTELRDEYRSATICTFGIVPSPSSEESARDRARRRLNMGFGCVSLASTSTVWCPVRVDDGDAIRDDVASAIHTITSPLHIASSSSRSPHEAIDMSEMLRPLVPRPRMNVISISGSRRLTMSEMIADGDEWRMRELSPIEESTSDAVSTTYALYGVVRGDARRHRNVVETFERSLQRRCSRARHVALNLPFYATRSSSSSSSASSASSSKTTDKEDTTEESSASAKQAKTSTACGACVSNSNDVHPFLSRVGREFDMRRENRAMLAYFSETGLDEEEHADAKEELLGFVRAYSQS